MKSINTSSGRDVLSVLPDPDHKVFSGIVESLQMTTSGRINSNTDLSKIDETRGNITAEGIDLSVDEKNLDWRTHTHHNTHLLVVIFVDLFGWNTFFYVVSKLPLVVVLIFNPCFWNNRMDQLKISSLLDSTEVNFFRSRSNIGRVRFKTTDMHETECENGIWLDNISVSQTYLTQKIFCPYFPSFSNTSNIYYPR